MSVEKVLTGPEEPPLTPEQLAIRREIRRYAAELLIDAGVSENPWVWLRSVIGCVDWWRRWSRTTGKTAWLALVTTSIGVAVAWFVTAYNLAGGGK